MAAFGPDPEKRDSGKGVCLVSIYVCIYDPNWWDLGTVMSCDMMHHDEGSVIVVAALWIDSGP